MSTQQYDPSRDVGCEDAGFPNQAQQGQAMPQVGHARGSLAGAGGSAGYVTKDSGERQQFSSGMQRDTTVGKLLFHLVRFGPMFLRWVSLLTRGAVKYEENNWMKANGQVELKRFIESADRHFAIWMTYRLTGMNIEDPENPVYAPLTEDHAAAVFFNINGAEYVNDRMTNDARVRKA